MAKFQPDDDMQVQALKSEMITLNRRMEEVITILTGSSVYGVSGIKNDVRILKEDVEKIREELEDIKRESIEKEKREGFLSIKLETIPQKIAALLAFLAVALTVFQSIKEIFTK